jgi:hypothetical protein
MTSEALERHWEARRSGVRAIVADLEGFKECDQCRSLTPKRRPICPFCGCYRFGEDPAVVRATLAEMGQRPYPASAGVVPRLPVETGGGAPRLGRCSVRDGGWIR